MNPTGPFLVQIENVTYLLQSLDATGARSERGRLNLAQDALHYVPYSGDKHHARSQIQSRSDGDCT